MLLGTVGALGGLIFLSMAGPSVAALGEGIDRIRAVAEEKLPPGFRTTLTGAMKVALGQHTGGLFANDDALARLMERPTGDRWLTVAEQLRDRIEPLSLASGNELGIASNPLQVTGANGIRSGQNASGDPPGWNRIS